MKPFTPDDPLWKLMGQARPVVPRPNFTQNVLRAARQEAQESGWQARVSEWLAAWRQPLIAGVTAAAVLVLVGIAQWQNPGDKAETSGGSVAMMTSVPDAEMAVIADEYVSAPLDSLDHMDALVAMEDTSSLTDTDLQFLLY